MKINEYIDEIKNNRFFTNIPNEEIVLLFQRINYSIESYEKEDIIFIQEDECKNLSIILDGKVEIQKIDQSGKTLTVARFLKGDTFGENLIFGDNNTFPMTVVSKDKSTILHINREAVINLCQENRAFLYEFLRIISNKAFILSMRIKEVTLKTIRQKICEFILWQSKAQNTNKIKLNMSKKEWAEKLGVQRPSLSRELIKMKDEGIIDFNKDFIMINNIEFLKDTSKN